MTPRELNIMDAFLDGTLPDEDRRAYEARLAADPGLARQLELQKILRDTLAQHAEDRRFADQMFAELRAEGLFDGDNPPRRGPDWLRWIGYGSLLLVAGGLLAVVLFVASVDTRGPDYRKSYVAPAPQGPLRSGELMHPGDSLGYRHAVDSPTHK